MHRLQKRKNAPSVFLLAIPNHQPFHFHLLRPYNRVELNNINMAHTFFNIDKKALERRISSGAATLIQPPTSIVRQKDVHASIKAVVIPSDDGTELSSRLAPFLCCDNCRKLFVWFRMVNKEWVNQSGMSAIKIHLRDNCATASSKKMNIIRAFNSRQSTASRKVMPPQTKNLWRRHVIDVLSGHPTLSINACAQVASSTANYAAELSHKTNVLYDYSIGRTYITEGLLRQGAESHLQLQALFSLFSSDNSCGVSVIVDFWSGRHQHRQSYGGIIACGLTQDWKWFSFPILLSELPPCSHEGAFTFNLLCDTVAPQHFVHPLFVCTDNEAKMWIIMWFTARSQNQRWWTIYLH